jgi:protease I
VKEKKALFVVAQTNFRDEEYFDPKNILEEAGILTATASISKGKATSLFGKQIPIGISISELNPDDYSAVIFVGGAGAKVYFENPTAHKIAQEMFNSGKIVAAICIAPTTLAKAGILTDKKATSFPSAKDDLIASGTIFTGKSVEKDGSIITADGPGSAKEFGKEILKALIQD